jgi:hypothetical protein
MRAVLNGPSSEALDAAPCPRSDAARTDTLSQYSCSRPSSAGVTSKFVCEWESSAISLGVHYSRQCKQPRDLPWQCGPAYSTASLRACRIGYKRVALDVSQTSATNHGMRQRPPRAHPPPTLSVEQLPLNHDAASYGPAPSCSMSCKTAQ